jgi:uncharacterized repeat protein (TIGR03803 family)
LLFWAATAITLTAQTMPVTSVTPVFNTLFTFNDTDGSDPKAALVQAANGNLYGTTLGGGASYCPAAYGGCGTVFEISINGTLATLHNFDGSDGEGPEGALLQTAGGYFYGTTYIGGANNKCLKNTEACGSVFKMSASGTLTMLYSFCAQSNCTDGSSPSAGLVKAANGNFYGTTVGGGINGEGTVFQITPTGKLTTLHRFDGTDGNDPQAALIQGTDGDFYGTTVYGGANHDGTVFNITPSGSLTTLHSFDGKNGGQPQAGLVQGMDGNFYGTTSVGGAHKAGTVFKIMPSGLLETIYNFCSQVNNGVCMDGAFPQVALVQGSDGNFYGTTVRGGGHNPCTSGCGTIFAITADGTLTTLYDFSTETDCQDGGVNDGGLVQDTNGTFYGTTGCASGVIFSLTTGLGQFVETNPAASKVGATIGILGTDLTGASSVSFNGIATAFRVASKTFIEAKVPSGATTGTIQVQLPGGTLSSNVPFTVLR